MRSCNLSQWRDLRIWSGSEDLGAATTARATEQENSGYAGDELTGFFEDHSTVSCSNRALSVRVMCQ